jgi:hypothetical protein
MVAVGSVGSGCAENADDAPASDDISVGRLAISMVPLPGTDVVAIKVKIVPSSSSCTAMALQEKTDDIRPDVALAPRHPATDAFFVLPPGSFRACITPLSDVLHKTPSALCTPADGVGTVLAKATTEIEVISQCNGTPTGGLDVLAALNRPPMITDLSLLPSKLVVAGNDVQIVVTATDPDLDFNLSFAFTQVDGPAMGTLTSSGATATFRPPVGGNYAIRVVVSDGKGGQAALTFPILVASPPP